MKIYMLTYDVDHEGSSPEGLFFFKSHAIARLKRRVELENEPQEWKFDEDGMRAKYKDLTLYIKEVEAK